MVVVGGGSTVCVPCVLGEYWEYTGGVLECTAVGVSVVCAWYGQEYRGTYRGKREFLGFCVEFLVRAGWRSNRAPTRLIEVQYMWLYCAVYPLRGTGTGFLLVGSQNTSHGTNVYRTGRNQSYFPQNVQYKENAPPPPSYRTNHGHPTN